MRCIHIQKRRSRSLRLRLRDIVAPGQHGVLRRRALTIRAVGARQRRKLRLERIGQLRLCVEICQRLCAAHVCRRRDRAVGERRAERTEPGAELCRGLTDGAQLRKLLGRERFALRRAARECARIVSGNGDVARDARERVRLHRQHAERHLRRLRVAVNIRADRARHGRRRRIEALLQGAVEFLNGIEHLAIGVAIVGIHRRPAAAGIRAAGDEPDSQRRDERRRIGNDEHAGFLLHSKPPLPDYCCRKGRFSCAIFLSR